MIKYECVKLLKGGICVRLLVANSFHTRELIEFMLQSFGQDMVAIGVDSKQAATAVLAEEAPFDIIISDVRLHQFSAGETDKFCYDLFFNYRDHSPRAVIIAYSAALDCIEFSTARLKYYDHMLSMLESGAEIELRSIIAGLLVLARLNRLEIFGCDAFGLANSSVRPMAHAQPMSKLIHQLKAELLDAIVRSYPYLSPPIKAKVDMRYDVVIENESVIEVSSKHNILF